jgi:hypothetical protein
MREVVPDLVLLSPLEIAWIYSSAFVVPLLVSAPATLAPHGKPYDSRFTVYAFGGTHGRSVSRPIWCLRGRADLYAGGDRLRSPGGRGGLADLRPDRLRARKRLGTFKTDVKHPFPPLKLRPLTIAAIFDWQFLQFPVLGLVI